MIASSPFLIGALREDECPSKGVCMFLGSTFSMDVSDLGTSFCRITLRGVWLSPVCNAFLHCFNKNMVLDVGHYFIMYTRPITENRTLDFPAPELFHLAYNWDIFIGSLSPGSTRASVGWLFPSSSPLILSLWPIPSLPDCF